MPFNLAGDNANSIAAMDAATAHIDVTDASNPGIRRGGDMIGSWLPASIR
jgi:hypothetical protein